MKKQNHEESPNKPIILSAVALAMPILVIILDAASRQDKSYCYTNGFNEGNCFNTGIYYFLFKIFVFGIIIASFCLTAAALARISKTDQKLFVALNAILTIILSLAAVALVIR